MNPFASLRAMQRYIGKIRTNLQEIRTIRLLNELPHSLRKDIGWPEACDYQGVPRRRHDAPVRSPHS